MYHKYFKRLIDIILSIVLLFSLFPLMILIFLIIWYKIGFPIFCQKRIGLNNKNFIIYKFKTLYDSQKKITIKQRQNKLGNFLRKTGLDELPQLINILKNDMSFIGPRPLLEEYLDIYSNFQKKRHLVKPGITGLAQVYPNELKKKSWKKSIRLDIYYVTRITFFLDVQIMFRTIKIIFNQKKQYEDFKRFNG